MEKLKMKSVVQIVKLFLEKMVKEGQVVIDATVGNGKDAAQLSFLVGPKGKVYAFDIQAAAIEKAKQYTHDHGCYNNIQWFNCSHSEMEDHIFETVDWIVFNLGYLPSGDKRITTQKETTLQALESGLKLLKGGGFIAVVLYPGHPEGLEETKAVLEWTSSIRQTDYSVLATEFINQINAPPKLILIEKRGFTNADFNI